MTDAEEWRAIQGWPGYEVSSKGRVRSFKRSAGRGLGHVVDTSRPPRMLRISKNRYCCVALYNADNPRGKSHLVHRLVLRAFVGEPSAPDMQSAHNDGDRCNNCASNLRWATPWENTQDKERHGTMQRGALHGCAKLTADDVKRIRARRAAGEKLRVIAADFNISLSHVGNIAAGRMWDAEALAAGAPND